MMKYLFLSVLFLFTSISSSISSAADRVALVIGNSKYIEFQELLAPTRDANLIARHLNALGFETILVEDGAKDEIDENIQKLIAKIEAGIEIGVVYFAGHSVAFGSDNYMLAIDAQKCPAVVLADALSLNYIVGLLCKSAKYSLAFHDASRVRDPEAIAPTEQFSLGVDKSEYLIGFATSPGNNISYGEGSSIFATALVRHLGTQENIHEDLLEVSKEVFSVTNGFQRTWLTSSLQHVVGLKMSK